MSNDDQHAPSKPDTVAKAKRGAIIATVIAVASALAWWIGAAVVPRWWAQRIGGIVEGRLMFGWLLGVALSAVVTVLALSILAAGWKFRDGFKRASMFLAAAVVVALPNFATLGIVLGNGSAAHAGERILDVDGPGFRAGSLLGAIVAVLGFAALNWLSKSARG